MLSVIDKNLQTFYLQQFKKEKNVETLDNNDYMYICSELASNINVNRSEEHTSELQSPS